MSGGRETRRDCASAVTADGASDQRSLSEIVPLRFWRNPQLSGLPSWFDGGRGGIAPLPSVAGARSRQLSAVQNRSLRFCRTLYLGFKSLRCRQKQKDPREEGLSVFGGRGGRDCAFAIHGRRAFAPAERCPKSFPTILSNPLTSGSRSLPSTKNAKGPHRRAFHIFGGRGGIRTLVGR